MVALAQGRAGWTGSALRRIEKGRNKTIEDAGYCGIPYPKIRYPDRHLADAEVVSLGLKLRICQMPNRAMNNDQP